MKSLLIRDLSEEMIEQLKARARRHHRSLQKEVLVLLGEAALMSPPEGDEAHLKLHLTQSGSQAPWSREEIYGSDGR